MFPGYPGRGRSPRRGCGFPGRIHLGEDRLARPTDFTSGSGSDSGSDAGGDHQGSAGYPCICPPNGLGMLGSLLGGIGGRGGMRPGSGREGQPGRWMGGSRGNCLECELETMGGGPHGHRGKASWRTGRLPWQS